MSTAVQEIDDVTTALTAHASNASAESVKRAAQAEEMRIVGKLVG